MELPNRIKFKSDDSECVLKEKIIGKDKEISGRYVFENGYYVKGKELVLPFSQIEKLVKDLRIDIK